MLNVEVRDFPERDIWFLHAVLRESYQMGRIVGTSPLWSSSSGNFRRHSGQQTTKHVFLTRESANAEGPTILRTRESGTTEGPTILVTQESGKTENTDWLPGSDLAGNLFFCKTIIKNTVDFSA